MNRTELRAELVRLVTELLDQPEPPRGREDAVNAALDQMDALDDIRDTVVGLRNELRNMLGEEGVVTKRCERDGCGIWVRVADTGRERAYCGDACRQAARRERIR